MPIVGMYAIDVRAMTICVAAAPVHHAPILVDATGRTSIPGVWAAGNAVDPRAQVITAAGQGSAAAIALNADLVAEEVDDSLRGTA